jgi:hypothetical protein
MPAQYEALKERYGKEKAAKIYVGLGKNKGSRSRRAKALHHRKARKLSGSQRIARRRPA